MRHVAVITTDRDFRRFMLVENPQEEKYRGGILCFIYCHKRDGPFNGAQFLDGFAIEEAKAELEEQCDVSQLAWSEIPDQIPGCDDQWIAPVRALLDDRGLPIQEWWERWETDHWVKIRDRGQDDDREL